MTDVGDVLAVAKDLIERYGWTQCDFGGTWSDGEVMPMCAAGAIREAIREAIRQTSGAYQPTLNNDHVFREFAFCLDLDWPYARSESDIIMWNDVEGRTKEEVLNTFDTAIERSRAGNPL